MIRPRSGCASRAVVAVALALACACAHAPDAASPVSAGSALPRVSVRTLAGEQVRLDQLRGPALVDIWATWCVPCARSLPFYVRLARESGIRVLAISIDAEDAPVRSWLAEHAVPFEILRDPDGGAAESLALRQMPTSFLIDSRGRVRVRHEGFREGDEAVIEAEVRALLAAP